VHRVSAADIQGGIGLGETARLGFGKRLSEATRRSLIWVRM